MNTISRGANDEYQDISIDEAPSVQEQLDLQHYLRILRKRKWPITLFTGLVTALAAYYAYSVTPVYSATSTLLIEQQKANVVSIEELYGVDNQKTDYYQTQFELLKSRSLAEKVIEKLDMWNDPELSPAARAQQAKVKVEPSVLSNLDGDVGIADKAKGVFGGLIEKLKPATPIDPTQAVASLDSTKSTDSSSVIRSAASRAADGFTGAMTPEELDRESVIGNFMARIVVTPVRKTKLVKISYESTNPAKAALVANSVGEGYIESYLESKLELTTKASSWLNERLATLKITLDESENRLIAFKQENGLIDVDGSVGRLNEQQLFLLTSELAEARSDLSDAADVYREVQSLSVNPDLLEAISKIQTNALVQRVKIEQGQAQRNLDELLNRYGSRHPRVVDAKSQLSTLDQTLRQTINGVVGTIEKDYQLLRQRVATIESKLASGKQEIQAIGSKKFELDALEREVATNQNIYDTFFNRMSEAKSADGLETANARVSDLAIPPTLPIKPKKQLIIALAALASLIISMLMAFLYEQMDDTVKGTHDVEGKLGMPLLGIFPIIKSGLFKRQSNLPLNPTNLIDPKGTFSEAVNTARTAICIENEESSRQVITITSSVPGEGKSTASINLAYSLAQLERVLLIDCDMRRPTVAKAAGFEKDTPGLVDLITNTASASSCIKRGVFNGYVDILPSGPIPQQPLELLSSKRFEKMLEQLKNHYDRIVIDSAPTQAVSDALILGRLSDAVVYAVKSHDTSMDLVKRGLKRLEGAGAPVVGILMTQVDIEKLVSYGGDYYYQGYYDYYGYTESGSKRGSKGKLQLTREDLLSLKKDDSEFDLGIDYNFPTNPDSRASRLQGEHDLDLELEFDEPRAARKARVAPALANVGNSNGRERSRDDLDFL